MKKGAKVWCFIVISVFVLSILSVVSAEDVSVDLKKSLEQTEIEDMVIHAGNFEFAIALSNYFMADSDSDLIFDNYEIGIANPDGGRKKLVEAIEELEQAILDSIDYDIRQVADSYALLAAATELTPWWRELARLALDTISAVVGTAIKVGEFLTPEGANQVLEDASTSQQIFKGLKDSKDILGDIALSQGLVGLYRNADSYKILFEAINKVEAVARQEYKVSEDFTRTANAAWLELWLPSTPNGLLIPLKTGTPMKEGSRSSVTLWVNGIKEVREEVKNSFDNVINEIPDPLPADYPLDETITYINNLKQQIRGGGFRVVEFKGVKGGKEIERHITLGLVQEGREATSDLFDAWMHDLDVQYTSTVHKTGKTIMHVTTYGFPATGVTKKVIKGVSDLYEVIDIILLPSDLVNLIDKPVHPLDALQYHLVKMNNDLVHETSNLWALSEETLSYLKSTWERGVTPTPPIPTIDVPFKAQVPPGSWKITKNCGQACSSMVFCYYWNTEPSEEDIKKIDNWLYEKYGDPIDNYNGWETTTTKLKTLACEYANFPKSYKAGGWNLEKLKQEIDAGHPVIVAIVAGKIPYRKKTDPEVIHYRNYNWEGGHFVVVKGYTSDCIICNDPATSLGDGKPYYNNDFKAAMDAQGGAVVVVIPGVILPLEAKPVLTSPLRITPEKDKYYVGDTIRAEFTVKNVGGAPITLDKLLVGGRFNGGKLPNGEYPDFTSRTITLQPDVPYEYTGTLALTELGEYHFSIAYYIENPTSEEKKLLDEYNWNTCVDLGDGLTDADRDQRTKVGSAKSDVDIRLNVPFFSQRDPDWRDQKLGKSTLTIGGSGCALTSAAMVSKYFGWDIDPLRLDAALTEIGGITTGGDLSWAKVEEASGGYVDWKGKKEDQEGSNIDQQLSDENPCIINGYWNDGKNKHKVVIRRKVGTEYHFWDPSDPPPLGNDRIWPNGAATYTWGNEESGNEELYDPRIYLYHKGPRPSEKNPISVMDKPPYIYKWSNKGDLKSWKKKKCDDHTYYSTYVGGMYYDRNNPKNDPNKPDCWMEFTPYLQSAGKYDIYVGICADSTRSTEVKYTIYPNGIDGSSETVSKSQYSYEECWKEIKLGVFDLTGEGKTHVRITDATGEAFDGKKTLCVGTIKFTKATDTLNILTPTQTAYRNVGAHDNPTKTSIEVEIKTSTDAFVLGLTNRDDYTVKIGDKTAEVCTVIQKSDRYVLEIMPPKQAGDGKYDLHVELGSLPDVENGAINYGTKGLDVALIIDSSGSMSDNDPEGHRKTAAKYFVDLANTGDKICVADFGHNDCDSRLLLPLLEITDESSRDTVKTAIDQVVSSGATPIGGGLEKGYDELSSPRAVAGHNKAGILLTDGEDTCDTEGAARTYAQKFGDNGWVLYTIGLTGDADEEDLLRELAALGNVDYKALTNEQLWEIYNALSGRVAGEQTTRAARGTAQQGSTSVENALIDSSVTKAKFTISWTGSDLNLALKKPDGGIINPDVAEADPNVIYTSASSYEFYTVQSPMPGEWELRIFGADVPAGGEEYTARIMGTANLTMNMYFDRDHYSVGEPIKVSVSLTDALQPITEASVIADIELSPTASSSLKNLAGKDTLQNKLSIAQDQITLFDDGMHGDGMANDGVYANFYTNTNIEGTYKFTAKATGTRSPEEFERVIEQSIYVSVTPTPRPALSPRPTLTPTPRPTLRPTATLFEEIEGLIAAIRVGVGI